MDAKLGRKAPTAKSDRSDEDLPLTDDQDSLYRDPTRFIGQVVPRNSSLTPYVIPYEKGAIESEPESQGIFSKDSKSNAGVPKRYWTRQEASATPQNELEESLIVRCGQYDAPAAVPETQDITSYLSESHPEVAVKRARNTVAASKSREKKTEKGEFVDFAWQAQGQERQHEFLGDGLNLEKGSAQAITATMTYMMEPGSPNLSERFDDSDGLSIRSQGSTDLTSLGSKTTSRSTSPLRDLSGVSITDQTVVEGPRKPVCWDHGCNGRQFSTFSNLLRHQRAKVGIPIKSCCPKCGAEFTRHSARDRHIQHDMCKPRRSMTTPSNLSPMHSSKEIQIARSELGYVSSSALLDSRCRSGNWISGELVERLGRTSEIVPTDHTPLFRDALGYNLVAHGQISLQWRWGPQLEVHKCDFYVLPWSSHGIDVLFGSSYITPEDFAGIGRSQKGESTNYSVDSTSMTPLEESETAGGGDQVQAKERSYDSKGEADDGDSDDNDEKISNVFEAFDDPASGLVRSSNDNAPIDLQEIIGNVPAGSYLHLPLRTQHLLDTGNNEACPAEMRVHDPPSPSTEEIHVLRQCENINRIDLERSQDPREIDDSAKVESTSRSLENEKSRVQEEKTAKIVDAAANDWDNRPIEGCYDVRVMKGEVYGLANRMKLHVENMTQESWDWWPLRPIYRSLKPDETRIQWRCVCVLRED